MTFFDLVLVVILVGIGWFIFSLRKDGIEIGPKAWKSNWDTVFELRENLKEKENIAKYGYSNSSQINDNEVLDEKEDTNEKSFLGKTDELLKLKQLLDEGVLTNEEFNNAKQELLQSKTSEKKLNLESNPKSTCSNCGGTNFKLVRSTAGKVVMGVLAPKNRAKCQTCGQIKYL